MEVITLGEVSRAGLRLRSLYLAKAIAFAKWLVWVQNKKCQKHAKNYSTRT